MTVNVDISRRNMSHGRIIESLAGAVTADRLGFNASIALSSAFVVGRHDGGDDDDGHDDRSSREPAVCFQVQRHHFLVAGLLVEK